MEPCSGPHRIPARRRGSTGSPWPATSGGIEPPCVARGVTAIPSGAGASIGPRQPCVRARTELAGHHQAVAGHPRVELAVDPDETRSCPGPSRTTTRSLIATPWPPSQATSRPEPAAASNRPAHLLERPARPVGVHRGEDADASAGHPHHGLLDRGAGVQGDQRGAVAAQRPAPDRSPGLNRLGEPA